MEGSDFGPRSWGGLFWGLPVDVPRSFPPRPSLRQGLTWPYLSLQASQRRCSARNAVGQDLEALERPLCIPENVDGRQKQPFARDPVCFFLPSSNPVVTMEPRRWKIGFWTPRWGLRHHRKPLDRVDAGGGVLEGRCWLVLDVGGGDRPADWT